MDVELDRNAINIADGVPLSTRPISANTGTVQSNFFGSFEEAELFWRKIPKQNCSFLKLYVHPF